MNITDYHEFDRLCAHCGITNDYYDIRGVHHVAGLEAKQCLLRAMGFDIHCDADIHASLEQIRQNEWQSIVAPVQVYQQDDSSARLKIKLKASQMSQPVRWQLSEEFGPQQQGKWRFNEYPIIDETEINGRRFMQFEVEPPVVFNQGYHRLSLQLADNESATSLLIVTPKSCYQPEEFEAGRKVWGISLQLYALRSKRNWGIGDFTDLQSATNILAPLGVDAIGLNPLHALFSHLPENASPYSPSNRDFLNPIYLDIESIEEFKRSDKARQLVASEDFHARLESLRNAKLVNYTDVWQTKLQVLEILYQQFRQQLLDSESERSKNFRKYQSDGGKDLFSFSLFEALQAFFHGQDTSIETWQQWPEAFQNPESSQVKNWAELNREKIEFYVYLQWQAELQILTIKQECKRLGMCIGIYNDLAVGNEPFSSVCWAEQSRYALDIGIGAPPDDFNLLGQNWGLPPQLPQALGDDAYRLFIHTLRDNMRHAGALRIDHVMGLMRLYWIPEGYSADQGAYVTYPFADLLGILALESQRNRCLIVGEDLGTVPDEVRHQLWLKKVLSYRIMFFEKDWHQGSFKAPHEYPQHALCTSGSHDLPTLKAYWQASDLELRETLNLFPSDEIKRQQWQTREHDRQAIKIALNKEQLITDEALHEKLQTELSSELFISIQRFLARSQSQMMMMQMEDILLNTNQVNVPGTIDEYPNWRHKLPIDLEDWAELSEIESIALAINRERNN